MSSARISVGQTIDVMCFNIVMMVPSTEGDALTGRACLSAQRFAELGEMAAHMPLSLVVVDQFETATARRQTLKTSIRATVAISLLIGIPLLISASVAPTQTAPPATLR